MNTQQETEPKKDGVVGWLVLPFMFLGQAMSVGFMYCYGIVYAVLPEVYGASESLASWIGSIGYAVCFCVGFITSCLCNRFGCGYMMSLGAVLSGAGILSSSFVTNPRVLLFTYSILTSMGLSLLFFSSLLVIPLYFRRRIIIATGVASAGSSVGCVVFAPVMELIIREYGLKASFLYYSALSLIPMCAVFVMRRRQPTGSTKTSLTQYLDIALLKNRAFLLFTLAMSIILFTYYVPYIYLNTYVQLKNISRKDASFLTSVLAFSSLVGKIVYGAAGQFCRINRLYMFQLAVLMLSICMTLLPLANNFRHFLLFSAVFGFFDGAMCTFIIIVCSMVVTRRQLDIAFGMMYSVTSLFSMVGAPFAGFLTASTGSHDVAFMVCGGIMFLGAIVCFALPITTPEEVKAERQALKMQLKCEKKAAKLAANSSDNTEAILLKETAIAEAEGTDSLEEMLLPDNNSKDVIYVNSDPASPTEYVKSRSVISEESGVILEDEYTTALHDANSYRDLLERTDSLLSLNAPCAMNFKHDYNDVIVQPPLIACV